MDQPTPSYYPPGWDRERMLNANISEIHTIPEGQLQIFRDGLRTNLGEQGCKAFFEEMGRREKARKEAATGGVEPPKNVVSDPLFMQTMKIRSKRTGWVWDQWGFVVFRSAAIINQHQWQEFRKRWDQIIQESVDFYKNVPGIEDVMKKLTFIWVDDLQAKDDNIPAVARRYEAMDAPFGIKHSLCLYVSPSNLESVMTSPLPSSAPRRDRKEIPYVTAVSVSAGQPPGDEDAAGADWKGYFNVAVESLLEELFSMVANDSRSPYEIAGHVNENDIWCDPLRYGIHKAGVGYWDNRAR